MSAIPKEEDVIHRHHCDDPESFLEAVAPRNALWAPEAPVWIFRGHADAKWALRPKAFREGGRSFHEFGIPIQAKGLAADWDLYSIAVKQVLKRFGRALDRAGLVIPTIAPVIERPGVRYPMGDVEPDNVPLMALAQHLGIPTPLLDWSRYARVAAYFAACEAAAAERPLEGTMCVWALRADFIHAIKGNFVAGTQLDLESAPAATNPNLHAQAGLFTWVRGQPAQFINVDDFVLQAAQVNRYKFPASLLPAMRQVTVPRECAPKLLRLLSYEGVSASTMFPGFRGVVDGIRERALWDQMPEDWDW